MQEQNRVCLPALKTRFSLRFEFKFYCKSIQVLLINCVSGQEEILLIYVGDDLQCRLYYQLKKGCSVAEW